MISIIIPLFVISERFFNNLKHFFELDYPNYEVIIVCDKEVERTKSNKKVKFLITGKDKTSPAEKRDFALPHCKGDICAFIDDDAYPHKNWLRNAVKHFKNPAIAAVGGPGITPQEDSFWQKASGAVYESRLGSGGIRYRFKPLKLQEVNDYPAYNLLIRRSILKRIGGFNSTFYGGEDTKVCLNIIKNGEKIIYDPSVIVYHHRRSLFKQHLKQIKNVGIHRGYFAKKFPETSLRAIYFIPSIATTAFIVFFLLSLIFRLATYIFLISLFTIWAIGAVWVMAEGNKFLLASVTSLGIILTHLTYGISFIKGIIIKNLVN
ncbi:glycosyltransferase [Patescibacteria group bacterium]|nr:glycosyltransferase [Patescibacteria group bacterium]